MMKCTSISSIVLVLFLISFQPSIAQSKLSKLLKKTEQKITKKLDSVVDRKVDKSIEKVEDVILSDEEVAKNPTYNENENGSSSPSYSEEDYAEAPSTSPTDFEHYSKFDFIPGNEVVFFDNYETTPIGDIPSGWNFSGNTEVVQLSHLAGNWLRVSNGKTTLVPPVSQLPENFTLEFDLVFDYEPSKFTYARYLYVLVSDFENPNAQLSKAEVGKNSFTFTFVGGANGRGLGYLKKAENKAFNDKQVKAHPYTDAKNNLHKGEVMKVSIWKTNQRMRVYMDEQKVFDVPRAFEDGVALSTFRLWTELSAKEEYFFISNLRLAASENTLQQALTSQGMYSSQGIYFDAGSAQIKPESYATLKQVAAYLQANEGSFFIAGHTDSDGDNEANRQLSMQRSTAVREALVKSFGVDTNRLASGGYGSKYPIASNASQEGKAQNRRVDFVNLSIKSSENYENELFAISKTIR